MRRLVLGALVGASLCVAGRAAAQTVPLASTAKVFATVDAVSVQHSRVIVTGIVQGEEAASTWAVQYVNASTGVDAEEFAAACQRAALIAMSKPGQYLLEIQYYASGYGSICKLSRVTP